VNTISGYVDLFQQTTLLKVLLNSVDILHFIPGRVRLYSKQLVHNTENIQKLTHYLHGISEIEQFTINSATGSILIEYDAHKIGQHPLITELENIIAKKYKGG
jgi:hypothetical protein